MFAIWLPWTSKPSFESVITLIIVMEAFFSEQVFRILHSKLEWAWQLAEWKQGHTCKLVCWWIRCLSIKGFIPTIKFLPNLHYKNIFYEKMFLHSLKSTVHDSIRNILPFCATFSLPSSIPPSYSAWKWLFFLQNSLWLIRTDHISGCNMDQELHRTELWNSKMLPHKEPGQESYRANYWTGGSFHHPGRTRVQEVAERVSHG